MGGDGTQRSDPIARTEAAAGIVALIVSVPFAALGVVSWGGVLVTVGVCEILGRGIGLYLDRRKGSDAPQDWIRTAGTTLVALMFIAAGLGYAGVGSGTQPGSTPSSTTYVFGAGVGGLAAEADLFDPARGSLFWYGDGVGTYAVTLNGDQVAVTDGTDYQSSYEVQVGLHPNTVHRFELALLTDSGDAVRSLPFPVLETKDFVYEVSADFDGEAVSLGTGLFVAAMSDAAPDSGSGLVVSRPPATCELMGVTTTRSWVVDDPDEGLVIVVTALDVNDFIDVVLRVELVRREPDAPADQIDCVLGA